MSLGRLFVLEWLTSDVYRRGDQRNELIFIACTEDVEEMKYGACYLTNIWSPEFTRPRTGLDAFLGM